jgi:ketosteroid isomerase-like protein
MAGIVQDLLTHHLRCFGKADIPGIMTDYATDARIFTPDGIVRGSEAIREFFAKVFEEHVKPGLDFHMIRQEVDGDTAYIVWRAETPVNRIELATDTFIVKDGRIVTQTFAAKISPRQ